MITSSSFPHHLTAYASLGDRLIIFDNHLKQCLRLNCSSGTALARFEARQPLTLRLFGWDCTAECRLQAQWATLEQLQQKKIIAHVPQFYGKVRTSSSGDEQ